MKGAKGGLRDRIISFLFSKKNEEQKNEIIQEEETKEIKKENKLKEEKNVEQKENSEIQKEEIISEVEIKEDKELDEPTIVDEVEITNVEQKEKTEVDKPVVIDEVEITNIKEEPQQEKVIINGVEVTIPTKPKVINENKKDKEIKQEEIETKENIKPIPTTQEPSIEIENKEEIKETPVETKEEITEEKVDISEIEVKEPSNIPEFAVFEELEKMIKDDYYEIQEIKYELDVLSQKEQDEVLYERVEQLQRELEELVKRFEKIKDKYEYVYSTLDFDTVNDLQDNYISALIQDYKNSGPNISIDSLGEKIKSIEGYINVINGIIYVDKEKDDIKNNIDEKLDKYEIRDEEFEDLKEKYYDIEKVNKTMQDFSNEQDKIMKNINVVTKETKTVDTYLETTRRVVPNINRLFMATLSFVAANHMPPTRRGNIARGLLLANAAVNASRILQVRETTNEVTDVKTEVKKEFNLSSIEYSFDSINNAVNTLDEALYKLKDLKEMFKKNFSEYASSIPEYSEMMKNLENMEKELTNKYDLIYGYRNNLDKTLKSANVKTIEK